MEDIVTLVTGPGGALIGAVFIIIAAFRGWWYTGRQYEKLEAEKDEWKEAALRGTYVAERLVSAKDKEVS
jgi:hypothetical protein